MPNLEKISENKEVNGWAKTNCKMNSLSLPDTSEKWINLSIDHPISANDTTRCELEFKNGTRLTLQTDRGLSLLQTLIPLS